MFTRLSLLENVEPAYVNKKDNRAAIILNTYCSLLNWHVNGSERKSTFFTRRQIVLDELSLDLKLQEKPRGGLEHLVNSFYWRSLTILCRLVCSRKLELKGHCMAVGFVDRLSSINGFRLLVIIINP